MKHKPNEDRFLKVNNQEHIRIIKEKNILDTTGI